MERAEKIGKRGSWLFRSRRRFITLALVALLLPLGYWCFDVFIGGNTHELIPGQVFRGAQLAPADLENLIKSRGIRTIINLRGCSEQVSWYEDECRVAQRLNVNLEDIGFSAYRFPHETEVRDLVEVLERAEYPIYLHCRRGADRTGLASAAVLLMKTNATPAEALRQLSIRYGHVALGKPVYLNWFFDIYNDWLRTNRQQHTPERFSHWARNEYRGGWYKCQFANFQRSAARANDYVSCEVDAINTGMRPWKLSPIVAAGMHLNYWIRDARDLEVAAGSAGLMNAVIAPGEKVRLAFAVPPLPAGRYQLFATMEDAKNFHLYQTGSEPLEVEFEVRQ